MKSSFSMCAAAALVAAAVLTGCGKPQGKPVVKAPEPPKAPQTVYGSAMAQGRATDCLNQMINLRSYLFMGGDWLPTSEKDLAASGCRDELLVCPGNGAKYEFLVKGKVRNAGKVPVLRCPTHDLVLYSDGSASSGR